MITTRRILGLRFFNGDVDEAVAFMHRHGGYLVAPSGTCFARLREDETYRRAVLAADLAIADSGLMVGLWRLLRRQNVHRISGLKYLKHLFRNLKGAEKKEVFGVLPTKAAEKIWWVGWPGEPVQMTGKNGNAAPRTGREVEVRDLRAR